MVCGPVQILQHNFFLLQKLRGKRALWILLSVAIWLQGPSAFELVNSFNQIFKLGFGLSPLSCIALAVQIEDSVERILCRIMAPATSERLKGHFGA